MKLFGEGVALRPLGQEDAEELWRLRVRNRNFLKPYEPLRTEDYYSLRSQKEWIRQCREDWTCRTAYSFGIFLESTGSLIGVVRLSGIMFGAFKSAHLGYFMDEGHTGKGWMSKAVRLVQEFAFGPAGLHRIQAAVMPRNPGSLRVLEKNGFHMIGLSSHYLMIDGKWEDHLLLARTAEDQQIV